MTVRDVNPDLPLAHAAAAAVLNVSKRTLSRWRDAGHIAALPMPGTPRYLGADVIGLFGRLVIERSPARTETEAQRTRRAKAALRAFAPKCRLAAV